MASVYRAVRRHRAMIELPANPATIAGSPWNPPLMMPHSPRRVWLMSVGTLALVLFMLATHRGWAVQDLTILLDASYRAVMDLATEQPWQFGNEIVFTHGPYGFLSSTTAPTLSATTAWLSLLTLIFALVLLRILTEAMSCHAGTLLTALMMWTSGTALSSQGVWHPDNGAFEPILALMLFLMMWIRSGPDSRSPWLRRFDDILMHVGVAALALTGLIKHNYLATSLIAISGMALTSMLRDRRFPWTVVTYFTAMLALWLAAGQAPGNIPGYIRGVWEIVHGFDAMALNDAPGYRHQAMLLGLGLLLNGLVVVGYFTVAYGRIGLLPTAVWWTFLLIFFKSAVVRHDLHVFTGCTGLLQSGILTAAITVFRTPPLVRHSRLLGAMGVLALVVGTAIASAITHEAVLLNRSMVDAFPERLVAPILRTPQHLALVKQALLHRESYKAEYQHARQSMREQHPLPPLSGTVDIYNHEQALVAAYSLNYNPRPVFQSYSAYTPALLALNRDHLTGPQAPDHIIFRMQTVDYRYPSLDDGLSWPELLTRYRPVWSGHDRLVLARDNRPRRYRLEPLSVHSLRDGEPLAVPAPAPGTAIWAQVSVRQTPTDHLRRLLYRSRLLTMTITALHGESQDYRLIGDMSSAGFLLSPCVVTTEDFHQLMLGQHHPLWSRYTVASVSFGRKGDSTRETQPAFDVALFRLTWDPVHKPEGD